MLDTGSKGSVSPPACMMGLIVLLHARLVLWFDPFSPSPVALFFCLCALQTEYGYLNYFSSTTLVPALHASQNNFPFETVKCS